MSNIPPYEQQSGSSRYTQFLDSRTIAPYIWEGLIGVSPQRRRAYMLQSRYLVPLEYSLVLLLIFRKYSIYLFVLSIYAFFWNNYLSIQGKIITLLVILLSSGMFFAYKMTQRQNSITIDEEIDFDIMQSIAALALAILSVYQQFFETLLGIMIGMINLLLGY